MLKFASNTGDDEYGKEVKRVDPYQLHNRLNNNHFDRSVLLLLKRRKGNTLADKHCEYFLIT